MYYFTIITSAMMPHGDPGGTNRLFLRAGCHTDMVQKKGQSLREFIQRFYNKRNVITEVDDKSIIMFFKKGLRDSSLIRKLAMKNPRTLEEMLAIANKCTLVEEATLDTREQKKEKGLGHTDQTSSSKGHNKKRKVDHSVNNVEPL
jgi:hypothetical protein